MNQGFRLSMHVLRCAYINISLHELTMIKFPELKWLFSESLRTSNIIKVKATKLPNIYF